MRVSGRYSNVKIETWRSIGIVILSRPDRFNIFSKEMEEEFSDAICFFAKEKKIRVIIVTGEGEAFCAGKDIKYLQEYKEENLERIKKPLILLIEKPVIAAVNGYAYGEGAEIVLMSDIVVGSEKAKFSFPAVRMGAVCPYAISLLPEVVGRSRAMELLMTGRVIDANEALAIGLVNFVVPHGKLMERATEIGEEISKWAPLSVMEIKRVINGDIIKIGKTGYKSMKRMMSTTDFDEGLRAFIEKRQPKFGER